MENTTETITTIPISNSSSSNTTDAFTEDIAPSPYADLDHNFELGYGIVSFFITPFVVIGNALVIISLYKFKRLRVTTNLFIGSLAFSDFSLGLTTLPLYAIFYVDPTMVSNKYLCLVRYSTVIFSLSSSLVNLVVIAIDRYIAIIHPLKYPIWMTKSRAKLIIAGVWTYHLIICSLPSLGLNVYDQYKGTVCDFWKVLPTAYTMLTTPMTILIGLIISLFLYTRIYKVASRTIKRKEKKNKQFSKDTKSAKAMGIILFFFFIFWVPFMLAGPLKYLAIEPHLFNIIKNFTLTLAMCNSAINPLMYCWLRQDFRKAFKDILCRCGEMSQTERAMSFTTRKPQKTLSEQKSDTSNGNGKTRY